MAFPDITVQCRFNKAAMTWTDISDYVERIRINWGRQRFLDRHRPGTIELALDNSDGRFDTKNLSGPYVSGGVSQVQPMVQVLVTADIAAGTRHLKIGFADSWRVSWQHSDSKCVMRATDGFKVLAQQQVAVTYSGPGVAARQILWLAPDSAWISPQPCTDELSTQQAWIQQLPEAGQNVLTLMQQVADSDRGDLYMAPVDVGDVVDGIYFKPYWHRQVATSQGVFTDDPGAGEWDWEELGELTTDDVEAVTTVVGQRTGGSEISMEDATALAANLDAPRVRSNTQLLHAYDDDVTTWVAGVLYRFSAFSTAFQTIGMSVHLIDDDDLWDAVCSYGPGTRITAEKNTRYSGGATLVSHDCFIEGGQHDIYPSGKGDRWVTRWALSDASRFSTDVFVLDSATRGKLDTGRLGF